MPQAVAKSSRSRVSNGKSLFLTDVDGRSSTARRWRDLYTSVVEQLEFGGDSEDIVITDFVLMMCRGVASFALQAELLEAKMAAGEEVDPDKYGRVIKRLDRGLDRLGILRQAITSVSTIPNIPGPRKRDELAEYVAQLNQAERKKEQRRKRRQKKKRQNGGRK